MELATTATRAVMGFLLSKLAKDYELSKRMREQLDSLRAEILSVEAAVVYLSEVSPPQTDELARLWFNKVRDLCYDVEDFANGLMKSTGDDSDSSHFNGFLKRPAIWLKDRKTRQQIGEAIEDMQKRARELAARGHTYLAGRVAADPAAELVGAAADPVAATSTVADPDLLAVPTNHEELVGVQEASDEIIKRLLSDGGNNQQQQLKILSVFGFGGVGKTTLAKAVWEKMRTQFDCTSFILVGRNPEVNRVFKDILHQIDIDKNPDSSAAPVDERSCINEIQALLKNKRYLIIVDDVWDRKSWEIIRCSFVDSNCGSIIITTTRIYDVAVKAGDVYKLVPLSHNNSEKLFYKRLFGGKVKLPDEQTTQLSQKLLQKCGGVPLAIITIATLLSSTPKEDWYKVYNSTRFGTADENTFENLRNVIFLSYYDLPVHLRACLLHLSIFPEDYMVRKDALIWMWVAQGFIRDESGVRLFDIGERYFNELINRSLIQPVKISHTGGIIGCRVHDLILDMICSITKEQVTVLNGNEQQPTSLISNTRWLALHGKFVGAQYSVDMPRLWSLNAIRCDTTMMPSLVSFKMLRVLAIEDCSSFQPEANAYSLEHIGKLLYLRYLGLWKTPVRKLPQEVGNLKFLEILDLGQTGIQELPKNVSLLSGLRCLHADGGSTRVPDWIGNLTSLEDLSLNDVSSCPNFVKEVSKLTELRELKIWIRVLDERSKKVLVKSLGNLQKIQVLHLDGGLWIEDAEWEGYVPSRQLCCLSLRTKSSRLPRWIKDSFLPNLSHLSLDVRVVEAEDLTILGSFPELTTLELFVPNSISLLFEGHPGSAFPKLRHCYTSGMLRFLQGAAPRLESVHFNVRLSALNGASFQCGFLGNLPLLMEVRVEIFHSDVEVYRANEVKESLRLAVEVHGNRPTLHVSKFKLSLDEDAEKEEDNVELEEDDEEDDWYTPTAKAT